MNLVDLFIIVIIGIFTYIGYKKSFISSFTDWAGIGISLWITLHFYGMFAGVVRRLPGIKQIVIILKDSVLSKFNGADNEIKFNIASFTKMKLSKTMIYFFEKSDIFNGKDVINFTELSIGLFVNVLSIIILFFVTSIILKYILSYFDNYNIMAGFSLYQKLGSTLFGFMKSLIYATLIVFIVYNASTFFNSGAIYNMYHNSLLSKLLYSNGVIEFLFGV